MRADPTPPFPEPEPEEGWDRLRTSVFAGTAAEDQAWGENGGEEGEPYPTTVDEEGRTQPAGMFEGEAEAEPEPEPEPEPEKQPEPEPEPGPDDDWTDPALDLRNLEIESASAKKESTLVRVISIAMFSPLQSGDLGFDKGEHIVVTDQVRSFASLLLVLLALLIALPVRSRRLGGSATSRSTRSSKAASRRTTSSWRAATAGRTR